MLQYSPKIITDSLVMCLDASQNTSYPAADLPVKNGLLVWLDAADDSTFSYSSGTIVSQWRDKSGNNFHANQSTTANQPSRSSVMNSRKGVFFNASTRLDYMLISSGISVPTDASIFIIYKPATQVYNYAVLIDNYHGSGNAGFVIQRVNNLSQFYYANGNGSSFVDASASPWTYTDNVIQLLSLNKSGANATPYISGTAQTTRTVYANTAQVTTGLAIGYWGFGGGRYYNGDMCEILIFNRSLSSTEMKQVHTYLGQKWGISNTDRSIVDLSNNNNNGLFGNATVANMPDYDFYNKGALTFNGSSDEVNFGDVIKFTSTQDFTLEVWVNYLPNATSYVPLLSKEDSSGFGYALKVDETYGYQPYLVITGTTSAYRYANVNINDGVWHHIVGVAKASSTTIDMYVDGVLINGVASLLSWAGTATTNALRLGKNYGSAFFKGKLSNSKIYNKALSATEISQNYEAQKSKFANTIVQQGLVLNLDAGNPYSYAGAGTTWYDVSGNSFNATLINSPTYTSDNGGVLNWASANSQYATVPMSSTLRVASITEEVWVYLSGTADQVFIGSQYGTSSNNSFAIWVQSGAFAFGVNTGGNFYYSTISTVSTGVWYNLTHTYNATTQLFYINGVLAATYNSAASGNISYDTSNTLLAIGADFNGTGYNVGPSVYTNGKMPVVRIYNIALSAAQVLQNYNATKGRFGL